MEFQPSIYFVGAYVCTNNLFSFNLFDSRSSLRIARSIFGIYALIFKTRAMNNRIRTNLLTVLLMSSTAFVGCEQQKEEPMVDNILLQEWTGPFGGVPAFDQMKIEDVKPAMLQGMEMNLKDIDAIASNTDAPTFENTIEEMERAGAELDRAFNYFGILSANMSTPEFRDIETELAPLFSEFQSKITQNEKLFKRIKAIYEASLENPLETDKQRVVELVYKGFEMNGAELDAEKKVR